MEEIKKDLFPILTLFIGLILGILITSDNTGISYAQYENDTNELAQKIDRLYRDLESQERILKQYRATEDSLMNIGASEVQAKEIIQASEVHSISPKF